MTAVKRYFGVFWILCLQFIRHNLPKNIFLMLFGGLAGLFQPLPIAMIALAGSMQFSGIKSREISIFDAQFQIGQIDLVVSAIVFAVFIYTLKYIISMLFISETERWQVTLMNKFVNLPSEFQRLDVANIEPDTTYRIYYTWAMRTLSGSVQIGLLFVYGLPNLILIVSLAVVVAILNSWVFVLLLLSLIILSPIYAIIMRRIYSTRAVVNEGIAAASSNLKSYIENRPKFRSVDYNPVKLPDLLGVTSVLTQHRGLVLLQVVSTFHISFILLGFVLLYERGLIGVDFLSILLFLVVFMFIRSAAGLIQFFGHINRNYPSIATLADVVKTRRQRGRKGDTPIMLSVGSADIPLNLGEVILGDFRKPKNPFEFQLLGKCFRLGTLSGEGMYVVDFIDALDSSIEYDKNGGPIVVCSSYAEYENLAPEIQNRFVWVVFGAPDSSELGVKLSQEGKDFTVTR